MPNDAGMNPEWRMWADMVKSDQMTATEIDQFLKDHPGFAAWYEKQAEPQT